MSEISAETRPMTSTLASFGTPLDAGLPRSIEFVRGLEEFDGPILSEYRAADGGGCYVEKWCAQEADVSRFLLVRSEWRYIAEFLGRKISMHELLFDNTDGHGFLIDRSGSQIVQVWSAPLAVLPRAYFPTATRFHDEDLRPVWETMSQSCGGRPGDEVTRG